MEQLNNKAKLVKKGERQRPVIKQTLTSMYRMLKANPLLLQADNAKDLELNNIILPKSVYCSTSTVNASDNMKSFTNADFSANINKLKRTTSLKVKENMKQPAFNRATTNVVIKKEPIISIPRSNAAKQLSIKSEIKNSNTVNRRNGPFLIPTTTTTLKKKPITRTDRSLSAESFDFKKNNLQKRTTKEYSTKTKATITRRSVSAENLNLKKNNLQKRTTVENSTKAKTTTTRRSLSAENFDIKKHNLQKRTIESDLVECKKVLKSSIDNLTEVSPIIEGRATRRVTFKSPMANKRRSKSFSTTPYAHSKYMSFASTPRIDNDLHTRLENWLAKHKKPMENYHHLKCFGVKHIKALNRCEENKENIEAESNYISSSCEALNIQPNKLLETPVKSSSSLNTSVVDIRCLACSALNDLYKLILDGYSIEQCEAWLGMIRLKYEKIEDESQYWECRAAIEQARGNLTCAVECLRTAIVHGAEIKSVDHSLEQLFDKFSLLNINDAEQEKGGNVKKDRVRIMCDARNVFKSSIIQFAVQERTLKKKKNEECGSVTKLVATPVRRSTRRKSRQYSLTPGVQIYSSLHDLDSPTRKEVSFETNSALSLKYP